MLTDVRKHYRFDAAGAVEVELPGAAGLACRLWCFEPGQERGAETCPAARSLYVLEGAGVFTIDETAHHAAAGNLLAVEAGQPLAVANPGPFRLVVLAASCPGGAECGGR